MAVDGKNLLRLKIQEVINSAMNVSKDDPFNIALNGRDWSEEELSTIFQYLHAAREASFQ